VSAADRAGVARRDALSVSFLDVLSCGMGAMIFLLLVLGAMERNGGSTGRAGGDRGSARLEAVASAGKRSAATGELTGRLIEIEVELPDAPGGDRPCWEGVDCPDAAGRAGAADARRPFAFRVPTGIDDRVRYLLVLPAGLKPQQNARLRLEPGSEPRLRVICGGRPWPSQGWVSYAASSWDSDPVWSLSGRGDVQPLGDIPALEPEPCR